MVISCGYEDNDGREDVIIYIGHGAKDEHQKPKVGNLAMERIMQYQIEVRVIRKLTYENSFLEKFMSIMGV